MAATLRMKAFGSNRCSMSSNQHNAVELLGHGEFFRRALHNPGDVALRMFRGRGTHLDAGQLDPRTADKPLEKEAITTPYIEEA